LKVRADGRAGVVVWRSWVDGCPNGESAEEMTARVDRLIGKIVKVTQAHHEKDEPDDCAGDVIVVCHGRESSHFSQRLPPAEGARAWPPGP
jgi:broad specificity phosphatase PhoE